MTGNSSPSSTSPPPSQTHKLTPYFSLRAINLITGILGRAGEAGRARRIHRAEREAAEREARATAAAKEAEALARSDQVETYGEEEWRYQEKESTGYDRSRAKRPRDDNEA